jgi:hypothetical protein
MKTEHSIARHRRMWPHSVAVATIRFSIAVATIHFSITAGLSIIMSG